MIAKSGDAFGRIGAASSGFAGADGFRDRLEKVSQRRGRKAAMSQASPKPPRFDLTPLCAQNGSGFQRIATPCKRAPPHFPYALTRLSSPTPVYAALELRRGR